MNKLYLYPLLFLSFLYFATFSYLSLARHQSLQSTYLDLGLESQVLWNTSQGRFFETSFGNDGQIISALSYHFTPVVLPLALLYRVFSSPDFLFLFQTAVVCLGGLGVYLIGRRVINSRILPVAMAAAYFLYPPLEYANLSDFHYLTLATTFLLFSFYFLLKKNWPVFYLFLVLSISAKEDVALVTAFLGLYLFLFEKERVRGLLVFVLSLIYFLAVLYLFFPSFGGSGGALGRYEYLGTTPVGIIINAIAHPLNTLKVLLVAAKVKYIFWLLVSVAFLPVLSLGRLLPALPELLLNLFSVYNPQWQVKFHYTGAITPFVFIASIYGASSLILFLKKYRLPLAPTLQCVGAEVLVSVVLVAFSLVINILHSPSPLFYKFDGSVFNSTPQTEQARKLLANLDPRFSVSAMNNLGPHLSNRRNLYRFPIKYLAADFVAVDPSAVVNYDLSQVTPSQYSDALNDLIKSGKYLKIVNQPHLILFKRIT